MRRHWKSEAEVKKVKTCTKCQHSLPEGGFYKRKTSSDGLASSCKECSKKYYALNKSEIAEKSKARRNKDLQAYNAKSAESYRRRKDAARAQHAKHYQQNKTEILKRHACYRAENKERINARYAEYSQKNRSTLIEKGRRYRSGNEAARRRARERARLIVTGLSSSYVKSLIARGSPLSFEEIPESLIEIKRLQIQILRAAKEIT